VAKRSARGMGKIKTQNASSCNAEHANYFGDEEENAYHQNPYDSPQHADGMHKSPVAQKPIGEKEESPDKDHDKVESADKESSPVLSEGSSIMEASAEPYEWYPSNQTHQFVFAGDNDDGEGWEEVRGDGSGV
jgi:hypothetical protein